MDNLNLQANNQTPDFMDTVEAVTKIVGFVALTVVVVKLAIVCFSSFGILGALFMFVLGLFFVVLLAAPVIGLVSAGIGVVAATIFAIIAKLNKKAG